MTDRIGHNQTRWLLLVIAVVGFAVAVISYCNLIASNCDSSGSHQFFSAVRDFHTQAGCSA